jgi:hypothetical protein
MRLGLLLMMAAPVIAPAASAQHVGDLMVEVRDATGLPIVGAPVTLVSATGPAVECVTDGDGRCLFKETRSRDRYVLNVVAPGFAPIRRELEPGASRVEVRFAVAARAEKVEVTARAASPFETVLTAQEIAALPDDPEEMRAILEAMAGPGAVFEINGFRGGRLPPKDAIREIRFRRNPFSADGHEIGDVVIQIYSRPGAQGWSGRLTSTYSDPHLNARTRFSSGEASRRINATVYADGPVIKNHTSVSLEANGSDDTTRAGIRAMLPGAAAPPSAATSASTSRFNVVGFHAFDEFHTLRLEMASLGTVHDGLGVGGLALPERGYRERRTERELRLAIRSAGRRATNELKARWQDLQTDAEPADPRPALDVLGSFSGGGAPIAGRTRVHTLDLANDLDLNLGRNTLRAGVLLQPSWYDSDASSNPNGTFTFPDLVAFRAGRPSAFARSIGDPRVRFGRFRGAAYCQDDLRLSEHVSLGLGVRAEAESGLGPAALAPRAVLAWTPGSGQTTVRVAAGRFTDWLDDGTFAEAKRMDGEHEHEAVLFQPTYPDPGTAVAEAPARRVAIDPGIRLPALWQGHLGLETKPVRGASVSIQLNVQRGIRAFRLDRMAPIGAPPYVWVLESAGRAWLESATIHGLYVRARFRAYLDYTWSRATDESDTPLSFPAGAAGADERGPALTDARHRLFALVNADLPRGAYVGVLVQARSGLPYPVTTGRDDNEDSVFNDRPAGVPRNSRRGASRCAVDLRLGWTTGFGRPKARSGITFEQGDALGSLAAARHRVGIDVHLRVSNVLNRLNPQTYVGVEASPLFGLPVSALPSRRIEGGVSVTF